MLAAVRGRGAIALALLVLVGCAGQTNRATVVGPSAATLNGARQCVSDIDGRWAWQWRELGAKSWSSGGASQLNCPGGGGALSHRLSGLRPDTAYQFRLLVDPKEPCNLRVPATCHDVYPLDANGVVNGTTYDTFTTQPQCDDVQGASESLAAFVASNPAGTSGDRRVLCLREGTQSIGQVNGLKAWSTLTPRGEADGTKQTVVLNGNLGLGNRGATIEDVRIAGCYAQSGCAADRNKTIDVRASDVTLRHLDITQQGGRNRDVVQCVLIDGGTQPTNVSLQHSKVHSCGSESSGNMEHGLYCSSALRPLVAGNWFYDNEGFGIQLYPNCDGALVIGNVVAENGGACDVDGSSTNAAYVNGFCGFARENVTRSVFPPIHCGTTSGSQAIDMVLYDPRGGTTDCGGVKLSARGTLNADPQFASRTGYDFRMGNPFARARLGIYAETSPGPRW
jgi:Right handed beta helix region